MLQVAGHWMSHDGSMVQHTTGVFIFLLLTLYMVHSNSYIIHMKSHFKMVFNLGRAKILGKRRLKLFRDYFIPKAATFLGFDFFFFSDESRSCVLEISLLFRKCQKLNLLHTFSKKRIYVMAKAPTLS